MSDHDADQTVADVSTENGAGGRAIQAFAARVGYGLKALGNRGSLPKESAVPGFSRITGDPAIMNGKPYIRGMRLTVRCVLVSLAAYPDREQTSGRIS